jgi:hypothetical protein
MEASECCGSDFRFGESIPASPFHRQAVGPAVFVAQGLSSRTDVAPPSRVLDLRMKSVTEDSLYVTLEWSAPGDNYDQGRGNNHFKCFSQSKYFSDLNECTPKKVFFVSKII